MGLVFNPSAGGGPGSDTTAIHDDELAEISAITEKATPVSADLIIIEDSAASNVKKKVQLANLPNVAGIDSAAIHDNAPSEISVITEKGSPIGADMIIIEDSADSNNKKMIQITNLPAGADADAIHDNVNGEINAIAAKSLANNFDYLLIEDSGDSYAKKKVLVSAFPYVDYTNPVIGGQLNLNTNNIRVDDNRGFKTTTGLSILLFQTIAGGGNFFNMYNKTTGNGPVLEATGSDTNVPMVLAVKGTSYVDLKSGGVVVNRTAHATSANTTLADRIIGVTDTSSAWTITLDTDTAVEGHLITIKDESGAAGTNNITIDTEGAETIDGAASVAITTNYGSVTIYSNGTNFFTI